MLHHHKHPHLHLRPHEWRRLHLRQTSPHIPLTSSYCCKLRHRQIFLFLSRFFLDTVGVARGRGRHCWGPYDLTTGCKAGDDL